MKTVALRFVLAFVVAIALAEILVRAAAPRLEEPLDYYIDFAQQMVAEMEQLQAERVSSDLVFAGTSMVQLGIEVSPFEAGLGSVVTAHKVALPGAQTPLVERWLLDEVVPRIMPDRVVWGVSSLDFNENRPIPMLVTYLEARAVRPGALGAVDRFLASALYLARYRFALRDPTGLITDLRDGAPPTVEMEVADLLSDTPAPKAGRTPPVLAQIEEIALSDFSVGQEEEAAFQRTVRTLLDSGIEVVVVAMPVPPEYVAAHPGGDADYELFARALAAQADELGIPLLDYSNTFTTSSFADYTHLRPPEAMRFSQMLAADLVALGW